MDGGGGGGGGQQAQPTTNTSYNVALQPELLPYATDIAGKSQALSQKAYTPYGDNRIAGFTDAQQQQQQNVLGMQAPQQFNAATQGLGQAGIGSLYAGQQYNQMATDPGAMRQFMSPYMQNAVDVQKDQAILDYQRKQPAMNAAATNAGAFGGSRQAIVQGMGNEGLQRQLAQIQGIGTQNAYNDALKSMQYGSQAGLQGLSQAGQMYGQLANVGSAQQSADLNRYTAQGAIGASQQALNQQGLSQQYQDFLKQQEYPYSQLAFYNAAIRGLAPVMPTTTQTYTSPPSAASQLMGLGIGGYSLGKMTGMV